MADAKYFRVVGRWRGFTKDDKSDPDEYPQFKGVSGGVTITARTSKNRPVIKAAELDPNATLISLWPMEVKLDDGRLKIFADSEDPSFDQPDVLLVANCPALGLDEGEQLIYTFTPHDVTANGQRQSLPSFSFLAPFIAEDHDDEVDGEITVDWTRVEWLATSQAAPGGGSLVRNVPDSVELNADSALEFYNGDVIIGGPVDISDLVWKGPASGITDSGAAGRAVVQSDTTDEVLTAAGGSDSGKAVFKGTPVQGVDALGLGKSGGTGNGTSDDRAAIAAADAAAVAAGVPLRFTKGTYRIASDLTISSPISISGGVLRPASGVTVTLAAGGDWPQRQVFDHSAGGVVIPKRVAAYHPSWWGPIGTVDDSQTWKDMAVSVAAYAASTQLYSGANFGVRVVAPSIINRFIDVELAYCEIDAGRGNVCFVPPAGTTSGTVLTLGNYAQINGGYFTTNESTQAVTLLYLKGYRAQADKPYVVPGAVNSKGVQLGSTSQSTTSPVLTNGRIIGLTTPAAGSIGMDVQSADTMVSDTYTAQCDIGVLGQRGSGRYTNFHVWGNNTGMAGDSWDDTQVNNLYLDFNRGWGADITNMDRAAWFGVYVSKNGFAIAGTGGMRFRRPSGSAQWSELTGVMLVDNVGTGAVLDGVADYTLDCTVSSIAVQSGGAVVTAVGVEITSGSTRTRLRGPKGTSATGATTMLVDNSTSTIYGEWAPYLSLAPAKTTPVDADVVGLVDSADNGRGKRLTWANLKAAIVTSLASTSVSFRDSLFQLRDAADNTKQAFLNVPTAQTTGTARTHTLPAVDSTLASLNGVETFTLKTIDLANNTVTGTVAQFNTAVSDGDFAVVPARVFAPANVVFNANTNFTTVLSATVGASKKYLVRGALVVDGNALADVKFRVQNTNATSPAGWFSSPAPIRASAASSSAETVQTANVQTIAATSGLGIGVGLVTGVRHAVQFTAYVETGTGGSQTLDCQVAQLASDASDTTLYAGSWMEVQEV